MSKQKVKQDKPKEIPIKDITVDHHKLGKVKLGDIPKNESCRMIKQLIEQNNQLNNQLMAANMFLEEIKVGDLEVIKQAVLKKIEAKKANMANVTNAPSPTDK